MHHSDETQRQADAINRLAAKRRDQREAAAEPRRSFDTSICAAPIRPRMPNRSHAGRIRRWISAGAVVALLAVAAHAIVADPLARLRWDLAWAERVSADQTEDGR